MSRLASDEMPVEKREHLESQSPTPGGGNGPPLADIPGAPGSFWKHLNGFALPSAEWEQVFPSWR